MADNPNQWLTMAQFAERQEARRAAHAAAGNTEPLPLEVFIPSCVVCLQRINFPWIRGDCGHFFCAECLVQLVDAHLESEMVFPPRCCDLPLSVDHSLLVEGIMGPGRMQRWKVLQEAFESPDPLHCCQSGCSAFIPAANIDAAAKTGICPSCGVVTCIGCRNVAHAGVECPGIDHDGLLRNLAQRRGWKACPACQRMIERTHGCNHMTCVCGTDFCYRCGEEECLCFTPVPEWPGN